MKTLTALTFALCLIACSPKIEPNVSPGIATFDRSQTDMNVVNWIEDHHASGYDIAFSNPLDTAAVDFVQLALRMGQLDGDYVDAYHGPKKWREDIKSQKVDGAELAGDINDFRTRLKSLSVSADQNIRKTQLSKLARAMEVRLDVILGKTISFDQEVSDIYDVTPPRYDLTEYDKILTQIDQLLPGEGTTADRASAFRNSLAIPKEKLQPIFERAIQECKLRTQRYFDLPETEKFTMEFVTDKSWSGYNYYQGNFESLIQINTDFPIIIDRAVDLGCHEGYPGHHVWNLFIEQELVGARGWIEYSVNPLFGPFGPLSEGSGNYGIELAFPGDEKIKFEQDVLYPMAGLDPEKAHKLEKYNRLKGQLSHATNEVTRLYLDGEIDKEEAIELMQKYYLASRERTEQRLRFVEKYRGYVINYNMGKDLAETYVRAAGDSREAQWAAFREMLTIPLAPSDIEAKTE